MKTRQLLSPACLCTVSTALAWLAADGGNAQTTTSPTKPAYAYATNGVIDNIQGATGSKWKLLLDESNLGGKELEAAEVTLPAGTVTPSHAHGPVEVIYVLEGTYDHEVNGRLYRLTPGMLGIVRPGDKVRHLATNGEAVKLLILWAPAGEAARILATAKGTTSEPVPEIQR